MKTNQPNANKGTANYKAKNAATQTAVKSNSGKQRQATMPPRGQAAMRRSTKPKARFGTFEMVLVVGVLLVVGLVAWSFISNSNSPSYAPATTTSSGSSGLAAVGNTAPDFNLPGTDGKTYKLSDFKGKVVLMEFMAPWCSHCQNEAPTFNQINASYASKGVQMLDVSATPYGKNHEQPNNTDPITMDDMKWFQSTYAVTYPMLFDQSVTQASVYGI